MIFCASVLALLSSVLCLSPRDFVRPEVPEGETYLTPDDFEAAKTVRQTHENVVLMSGTTENGNNIRSDPLLRAGKYEGDILGFVNASKMHQYIRENNRLHRNAINKPWLLWVDAVVPYTISTKYGNYSRMLIAKAMDEYQKQSCIRFKPRESEVDYVHIFPEDGCYSLVGRVRGKQPLSLDAECFQFGTILHEMMHTVGFFHEQSRPDRDEFIQIYMQNVDEQVQDQFEKYSLRAIQTLGLDYDYSSIMHYGPYAFSKNGRKTIVARKEGGHKMGQRDGFSKTDIAKLNKLYQCESHTDEAELTPDDTSNTRAPLQTECIDKTWRCKFWKIFGYCDQDFYQRQCQKSCRTCRTSVVPSPTTSSYNRRVTTTTITTRPSTPSETNPEESDCEDISSRCKVWADSGMCHRQKMIVHMKVLCKLTCNLCFTSTVRTTKRQLPANRGNSIPSKCEDQFSSCRRLVETGRGSCTSSFQKYCRKSCGLC